MCVRKISAQCVLQFTPSLAAGCVLHRPVSRVIHCSELSFEVWSSPGFLPRSECVRDNIRESFLSLSGEDTRLYKVQRGAESGETARPRNSAKDGGNLRRRGNAVPLSSSLAHTNMHPLSLLGTAGIRHLLDPRNAFESVEEAHHRLPPGFGYESVTGGVTRR
jgi:hypothetical protein